MRGLHMADLQLSSPGSTPQAPSSPPPQPSSTSSSQRRMRLQRDEDVDVAVRRWRLFRSVTLRRAQQAAAMQSSGGGRIRQRSRSGAAVDLSDDSDDSDDSGGEDDDGSGVGRRGIVLASGETLSPLWSVFLAQVAAVVVRYRRHTPQQVLHAWAEVARRRARLRAKAWAVRACCRQRRLRTAWAVWHMSATASMFNAHRVLRHAFRTWRVRVSQ